MNKHIPAILLAIICVVLAIALYRSNQEISALEGKIAKLERAPMPRSTKGFAPATTRNSRTRHSSDNLVPRTVADKEGKESANRRMMSNLSKMMENPTMNKIMESSQRGALNALYGDLIKSFEFTAEEGEYFMDLLMSRQMKQLDFGMKMMGGKMSNEKKKKMGEELKEVSKTVKTEMKKFLNNTDDYSEFKFYEKTMGERMMLSQMTQKLDATDAALPEETHRELLGMMHDEKKNFNFNTNLHDNENMDMKAERFSKDNLQQFANDMDKLNGNIIGKAGEILSPEQLNAFKYALKASSELQKNQLDMASKMLGDDK
jgi:hypothetical protein